MYAAKARHRVLVPLPGRVTRVDYLPGALMSVNATTARLVPNLFDGNQRVVCHFSTGTYNWALVLVGALNVGSISTPWTGEIRPRKSGVVDVLDISSHPVAVDKGDLLGWFNMGSTVILLLPPGACEWDDDLEPGHTVRMGEEIGETRRFEG